MENQDHSHNKTKRSMSDTESQTSQMESFHSPLRSDSPIRSDDPSASPAERSPVKSPSKKLIVSVDRYDSPLHSPTQDHQKQLPPPENWNPPPPSVPAKSASPVMVLNRAVREDMAAGVTKVGPAGGGGNRFGGGEDGAAGGGGGEKRSGVAVASILRRSKRDVMVNRAALGFRVCEVILCLISFSVMAADKTQGWSGDSFDRYKEYRYCLSVTVIAFVYSGFQAFNLAYHLITGKHVISHHLRYHFDFSMDQILAYLLISASSSAATRVDDWVSNWGRDEFTEMASASVGMSFLAFAAFALSSLISGYNLCKHNFT